MDGSNSDQAVMGGGGAALFLLGVNVRAGACGCGPFELGSKPPRPFYSFGPTEPPGRTRFINDRTWGAQAGGGRGICGPDSVLLLRTDESQRWQRHCRGLGIGCFCTGG